MVIVTKTTKRQSAPVITKTCALVWHDDGDDDVWLKKHCEKYNNDDFFLFTWKNSYAKKHLQYGKIIKAATIY